MRKVLDPRIKTSKSKQDPHAGIGNSKYGRMVDLCSLLKQ